MRRARDLAEEAFGGGSITRRIEHEVQRRARRVHSLIEVVPLLFDLDVGFIHAIGGIGGVQQWPASLVEFGGIPLLVSGPFPVHAALFVAQPKDATDWLAHVAPQRQWVILLSGRVAVTTDGERREFIPGDVILAEDTTGQGRLSTPLTADVTFVMIPVAPY
jgi:hypothetical protein